MASFDDVDIFGPPAPLPDIGYGLEPMEPTPAMQRRDTVAKYLQKIGYEPRRSYQMAEKMAGTGELVGEFLPGTSKALAEERDDVWGERLSYLDLLGPAGAAVAIPVKAAKKGIKSLSDAPRLKRAKDMGFDVDNPVYHGTTHKVDEFDLTKGEIEGHFGDAIYFTDSPVDASKNYARKGPDLTAKIQREAERLNYGELNYKELMDLAGQPRDRFYKRDALARKIAQKLHGSSDNIIPAYLKMEEPLDMTKKNKGWEHNIEYDEAGDYVDETGNAIDLYESIMVVARKYDFDGQKLFNDLDIYDFKSFADTDDALRKSDVLWDVSDEYGNLASNQAIKEIYQGVGFDGVIIDAHKQFSSMDIPKGTKHYAVFEPKQVRSIFAKFDPTKAESAKIAAGITGVTGAGVIGSTLDEPLEGNTREIL